MNIKEVFNRFNVSGTWLDGKPTDTGHIHTTWFILTHEEDEPDYVLQKINDQVFPAVAEMMNNIQKITSHIKKKNPDSIQHALEVVKTKENLTHYTDSEGFHWRMYRKVDPGISYDVIPNYKVAFEAGKAFGKFISDLEDFPADGLFTLIPDFHSVEWRYQQLAEALARNSAGRAVDVNEEIAFAKTHFEKMRIIPRQERAGKLPVRITHNDTKLNNILFDEQDRAVCVIDLDTVMPGLTLYDFGDLIRTATNTAREDEPDLERIQFNNPVFREIASGFIESTSHFLTKAEIELLALSAQYMTYIMGIRFLADYLSGDIYYHTSYEDQNLRRCKAQFRLMQRMIDNYQESREVVREIFIT